jgi:hypothetical protein
MLYISHHALDVRASIFCEVVTVKVAINYYIDKTLDVIGTVNVLFV